MRMLCRRGVAIIYVAIAIATLAVLGSFAVDYGKVQLAKTELRRAVDAAARAGASGLGNYVTAQTLATQYASLNAVANATLTLDTSPSSNEVTFGTWDDTARTFSVLNGVNRNYANAIKINVRRSVALSLGSLLQLPS